MRRSYFISLALMSLATQAAAHDGGFGHSRRTLYVTTNPAGYILEYRITQTADVALVEMTLIDADGDGQISDAEKNRYFTNAARDLAEKLRCTTIRNQRVQIEPVGFELHQALGQVFRFRIPTKETELLLADQAFPHKPGVVRVITGPRVKAEIHGKVDLNHAERVVLQLSRTD